MQEWTEGKNWHQQRTTALFGVLSWYSDEHSYLKPVKMIDYGCVLRFMAVK